MIKAHFNGGPYDDRYMALERDDYRVPLVSSRLAGPYDQDAPVMPSMRYGQYLMRRNFAGEPVYHNLAGVIEFDWDWR